MGLTESLRNLDQKYPSSFLGLVVGIIIGVLGIYLTIRDEGVKATHLTDSE